MLFTAMTIPNIPDVQNVYRKRFIVKHQPTIGRPPGPVASLHEPPGSPGSGQASGIDAEIAVRAPLRKLLDAFVSTGQLAVGTKAGQPG
jgi:hypothetical protein